MEDQKGEETLRTTLLPDNIENKTNPELQHTRLLLKC